MIMKERYLLMEEAAILREQLKEEHGVTVNEETSLVLLLAKLDQMHNTMCEILMKLDRDYK